MFDMRNFGDLLFPLMAQFRLRSRGIEVMPVAPTSNPSGFADALDPVDIRQMISGEDLVDGILIGGGYLIHSHALELLDEYRLGDLASWAGPGLWLGASLASALRDVPVVWNAPGVPHPLAPSLRPIAEAAVRAADYVAVRDRGSAELLALPQDLCVEVVPDSIAELARLWPASDLKKPFKEFLERTGANPQARFLALHFRNRSLAEATPAIAASWISDFASSRGLTPVLVAVGQTHHDHLLARELGSHLKHPHVLLEEPASLKEIAAVIAHANLYIGASLHGYIAAQAYQVPGILVGRPAYRKFRGFLEQTGRTQDLARDWPVALRIGADRLGDRAHQGMPGRVFTALDQHWDRIAAALADPAWKRGERRQFLRTYIQAGFDLAGGGWVHRPFVGRALSFTSVTNMR